jgi:hypothetical protein
MSDPLNAAEMTPEQKLKFLHAQILAVRAGELKWLLCPYCGVKNHPTNEHLCCQLFSDATVAILDRMEKQDALDFMGHVADRQMDIATKKYVN